MLIIGLQSTAHTHYLDDAPGNALGLFLEHWHNEAARTATLLLARPSKNLDIRELRVSSKTTLRTVNHGVGCNFNSMLLWCAGPK